MGRARQPGAAAERPALANVARRNGQKHGARPRCARGRCSQLQNHQESFQLSIDYLKENKTCPADQKIRLYRGIGEQQIVQRGSKALVPWSILTYKAAVENQPIPAGKKAEHSEDVFIDLTQKTVTDKVTNVPKGFRWNEVAWSHSGKGSKGSAIISTSMEWSVSKRFAKPYLLVMDICPERALALFNSETIGTFPEAEVYVPLFVLPEEIVKIVNVPDMDPFYKLPADLSTPPNQVTQALRRNFFSKDLPFDVQFLTRIAIKTPVSDAGVPSQKAYFDNYHPQRFYSVIMAREQSRGMADWRRLALAEVLKSEASDDTCRYALDTFERSDVLENGQNPKRSYTFPMNRSVARAQFNLAEYRQVSGWHREWVARYKDIDSNHPKFQEYWDGVAPFSEYFDNFENFHIVNDKLTIGYLEGCRF